MGVPEEVLARGGETRRAGARQVFFGAIVLGALLTAALYEFRTSSLQAWLLSRYASKLSYQVGPGASPLVAFPASGPFDERRGYSRIPEFHNHLQPRGYRVSRQARMSPEMAQLVQWGIAPPYPEPNAVGLKIRSFDGTPLYDAVLHGRRFEVFEDIPRLLVETLLFIENRELPVPPRPSSNPAIEWSRFAKASLTYLGNRVGLPLQVQGGSTLATQLEKFRHSPHGRTRSMTEKLKQVAGASLKAYRTGLDTRAWRREIVLDYLNTMPLSGAPEYGEIYGLGEGLHAWFGMELDAVQDALSAESESPEKIVAYNHVLALVAALPAPTTYLIENHRALEERMSLYIDLLTRTGIIDEPFARAVKATPLRFAAEPPIGPGYSFVERKPLTAVRASLTRLLGVSDFYELDRLHLDARSSLDPLLQNEATQLFRRLADAEFVAANGLTGERLLERGDPRQVIYSLMLYERTAKGNALRVHADNLDRPLDVNEGVKMELGSTAKLRTLAHYLEIVADLHQGLSGLEPKALAGIAQSARDPLTRWAAETLSREKELGLAELIERSLTRRYSASPYESFFTGGGLHSFRNFNREDNGRFPSLREALRNSTNLVFIRLMRDLVRYHQAHLPYDAEAVLRDTGSPLRRRMLTEIGEEENLRVLRRGYRGYRGQSSDAIVTAFLGSKAASPRHLSMFFFATHPGAGEEALGPWLERRLEKISPGEVHHLREAYGNPHLTLADFGFLLDRHPIDLWSAVELIRWPDLSWHDFLARSGRARDEAAAWLFQTRNRAAQDRRLRIRIERDAFVRMTPDWRRLGFPFERLVPSYATAIGNSSDRPAALADLMGIIVNDGVRLPSLQVTELRFAEGTPYETVFESDPKPGEKVMPAPVARVLRSALAEVVSSGTARRVAGAFVWPDGTPVVVGGKTGSGDNRFRTFNRWGGETSSRAVNRTATFVFYVGDRYFGVLTAFVPGHAAEGYGFTSALPVAILKLLAPGISQRLAETGSRAPAWTVDTRLASQTSGSDSVRSNDTPHL